MFGLADRFVFVACILAAGALPGFVQQYRQQVDGRLAQVEADLAPFQRIALRRHNGDLDVLIKHHADSGDETFEREGEAIAAMRDSASALGGASDALNGAMLSRMWYLLRHLDPAIGRSTWRAYAPAIVFDSGSLVFALIGGTVLWLTLRMLIATGHALLGVFRRPASRSAGP